ncbi:tautomerase family protein [Paenibacillus protaetiae]|uniref:tautomerase family protein n=1 Tax=Paenibacillus protaetiae TaxID=2509456 RepID=UPI001FC9A751|nr:tautomerase family protein [Paenibacillus protaetiae]
MPFVRIDYRKDQYRPEQLDGISTTILTALIEQFSIPEEDYFQVFTSHSAEEFRYSPSYLEIRRSDKLLYIQVTMRSGRTQEQKLAFYDTLARLLQERCQIRKEDIFVQLMESELADWSFGMGEAQMIAAAAGKSDSGPAASETRKLLREAVPQLADYTDQVLFGDLWLRQALAPRDRSLITVAALIASGETAQLRFHMKLAMDNGVTEAELTETITHLAFYAGWPRASSAAAPAAELFAAAKRAKA